MDNLNPVGLGTADLKQVILNFINLATGLTTLVALFMLTIAGFRWMTSGHKEEFRDQAKRMFWSAIIGEIIVLLAWTIVSYFLKIGTQISQ